MIAHRATRRTLGSFATVGIVALVLAGLFLFGGGPEHRVVTSADGMLTVTAEVPRALNLSVTPDARRLVAIHDLGEATPLVYLVEPLGTLFPRAAVVRFAEPAWQDADTIAWYDLQRAAWVPVATRIDASTGVREALIERAVPVTLFSGGSVWAPEAVREQLIKDALQSVPTGAHAYRVDLAYGTVQGSFALFAEAVRSGSCALQPMVTEETIVSMQERAVDLLLIDGQPTTGWMKAIVTWDVGTGCANLLTEV